MFCPTCGAEQSQTLSYCNRCGANLRPLQSGVPPAKLVGASWAISLAVALVTLGGFGMIFGLILALISSGMSLSAGGIGLVILSSLIILAIDCLLIRQLSRVLDLPRAPEPATQQPALAEKIAIPLPPHQPASSVTDQTTRTFEPIVRDRDTQR